MAYHTAPLPDPERYITSAVTMARSGRPIVVFDTETTGLYTNGEPDPEPWQLAALKIMPDGTRQENSRIIRTKVPIPARVCEICHVEPDLPQRKGKDPAAVLKAFTTWIEGAIMVGQNSVEFDHHILRDAYVRASLPVPHQFVTIDPAVHVLDPKDAIDTKWLAQAILIDTYPRHRQTPREANMGTEGRGALSLAPLATFLGIEYDQAALHDALVDVRLCEKVFNELIIRGAAILRAGGIKSISKQPPKP
jgi:DNA polymerase III epsilon subunit-like protein